MGINIINGSLVNANARCQVRTNISTAIVNGALFQWNDIVYNEGFTVSAGQITVLAKGNYRIHVRLIFDNNSSLNTRQLLRINNGAVVYTCPLYSGGEDGRFPHYSFDLDLEAGDIIDLQQDGGSSPAINTTSTWITVTRSADYTAGGPTGFGLADEDKAGLVQLDNVGFSAKGLTSPHAWVIAAGFSTIP
jgi:hypothetical protein